MMRVARSTLRSASVGLALLSLFASASAALADTAQPTGSAASSMVVPLLIALVALGAVVILTRPRKKQP